MLKAFNSVKPFLKFNPKKVVIDNFVFKLHYRWTFILLLVSTILVSSQQYIGEHIKCISGTIPERVINTFCFFTPTFTVVRHLNNTALAAGAIFQPGIGPLETYEEPIKRHGYYQWVPFVLFGQAICFYLPHVLWKSWEGGRIRSLVFGLRMVGISQYIRHQGFQVGNMKIPSLLETELRVKDMRRTMIERMRLNQSWGAHLVFTEIFNLANLMLQIYVTNWFLGGAFYTLGIKVLEEKWIDQMDALDIVFPKVTKCHFHKYGPGGSLQLHDTLCVMSLNIINEKIYSILWFWYSFLLIVTTLGLIWRFLTLVWYKKTFFSRAAFYWTKPGRIDEKELAAVIEKCNFSNWMFLFFLRTNLSEFLFKKVIYHLSSELPSPELDNNLNSKLCKRPSLNTNQINAGNVDEVDAPLLSQKRAEKVD